MEEEAAVVSGWRKGQRNPVPERCRKCVFRAEADTSLSRFHCWAGVRSTADAGACAKRRLKAFSAPKEQT
ncbi:MAG: hypothetical protein A2Y86_05260 [Candidatus Aminicenantes bacterium RBG_13_62_12]|nr:MAG: hypothetical protein A2Y86_05260 [Candidatus Aminicenantes bacterium RBG_13_62_12]